VREDSEGDEKMEEYIRPVQKMLQDYRSSVNKLK
jgi:hypothetical protein